MSDETTDIGFAAALNRLIQIHLDKGTPVDEIAVALEEAALQTGEDEDDGEAA